MYCMLLGSVLLQCTVCYTQYQGQGRCLQALAMVVALLSKILVRLVDSMVSLWEAVQ